MSQSLPSGIPRPLESVVGGIRTERARLTSADVLAIREAHASGEVSEKELTRRFGVHYSTIQRIVRNEHWTDLVPNEPLREAFLASRTPIRDACWWLGVTRTRQGRDGPRVVADVGSLKRQLGLIDAHSQGRRYQVRTIRSDLAQRLCSAIGVDYHELYTETQAPAGHCACGEPLYREAESCSFCLEEQALGVAA